MDNQALAELDGFLSDWEDTEEKNKAALLRLKAFLEQKEGVRFNFIPRPGVTYSVRAAHASQKEKSLFAMLDIIEDSPRWLSVCFYGAMISDPDENGDFVPEGLLGEDAICFDIDQYDDELLTYVEKRLDEAWQSAQKE